MQVGSYGYDSWIHNNNTPKTGNGSRSPQTDEVQEEKKPEDMTYREQILAHMEEMAKKVKDGTVEPTFQTGAQTFTIKEWEKLLADFDDAEEALQEQIKELIAEVEKQAAKEALRREAEGKSEADGTGTVVTDVSVPTAALPNVESAGSVVNPVDEMEEAEKVGALLTDEVTKCTFPTDDPKQKHWFITCYGQDGISCKEAWFDGTKWVNKDCWSLSYTEPGQYEKVMALLQRFPQDANLRFASHKEFWEDFLAGEIDEDDFVNFFETSTDENGVPNYTYEKDGSTYIDREKAKYAKYMNDFGAHFYTAEEMDLIWRGIIHENRKGLQKISDYDGQMTIPKADEAGKSGKDAEEDDDDLETKIITKPDGSTVLEIKTSFGVMEVEITEAQKFGLQYEARQRTGESRIMSASPFAHAAVAYEAGEV